MTAEVPDALWDQLASDDEVVSLSARHQIAVFYQGLVEGCARKLEASLPTFVADEDLLSAGQEGLLKAISRYDLARGIPFRKFASAHIHGAIVDDLRRQDWAPRSLRQNQRDISKATKALTVDGAKPSLSDVAEHLGWDEVKVESTLRKVKQASVITGLHYQGEVDLPEALPATHSVQLVCALFVRDYQRLPGPVQVVLARIYYLNQTLTEVSSSMGLSLPVVRRLHMDGVAAAIQSVEGSLII